MSRWSLNNLITVFKEHSQKLRAARSRYICFCWVFFCLGFLPRTSTIHRTAGEGEGYRFKLLSITSDSCRELTSAHRQRPDSNWELLVSKCKSLTTKLSTLAYSFYREIFFDKITQRELTFPLKLYAHITIGVITL